MKKIYLLLLFLAFGIIFYGTFPREALAADPANLKRFGVGWGYLESDYDVFKPIVFDLGVGWITNWRYDWIPPNILQELTNSGLDNMPLVLKERGDEYSAQNCQDLKNYVAANSDAFPVSKTFWSVGNELGFDIQLTANEYATEFVNWRDCIKSINPNYKVGSGAIISLWTATPRTFPTSCVNYDDPNSGASYLRTYINRIKAISSTKLPDFMVMHAYYSCTPPTSGQSDDFSKFENHIISHRQLMKELGLQNKELWVKEFFNNNYSGNFVDDSIDYFLNTKDSQIGYPADENRLVQRFAWFHLRNYPGTTVYPQTLASSVGVLTTNGQTFRSKSRQYAGAPLTPPGSAVKDGDANGNGIVNAADLKAILNSYLKNVTVLLNQFSDIKINVFDFVVVLKRLP